ncbi:Importin beta-like protein [Cyphellophora attinorum]|uniref:Importin beta-like protein n=1 Tax=Cyphellophora attinorum TaxID=1664694 RepID=A0A0N1HVI0_9EURO|nr:Importin beta-like protein [Phialophora attinorum]KPI41303.1 Importin beta-like protein [Phialophora attinorum]
MPSFSIEVEGEANPLSRQVLLSHLSSSLSSHHNLKTSAQQFSNWERTSGYYALLQDLYADFSLPQEVRFQAIIQLKNGIDKHWKKHSQHAILQSEKVVIRDRAISLGVHEPVQSLALQNALMLAKIVRYEYPNDWPDVFTTIIEHLRKASQDPAAYQYTSNILMILLHVIKELAAGRLQKTKRSLQLISSELLQVLGTLYLQTVELWINAPGELDMAAARNSHSALKTLRRLLVSGFEHQHREAEVKQFWDLLQDHQQNFWITRQRAEAYEVVATKHLLQLAKLFLEMARQHPAPFVLLGSMEILNRSWTIVNECAKLPNVNATFDWEVYRDGDSLTKTLLWTNWP